MFAVLLLAIAFPLLQWSNVGSRDPLSEFSAITGMSIGSDHVDEWARHQFGASANAEAASRIARSRVALERRMASAMARADHQPIDWSQVAAWANIAQAIGAYDADMLELAADLNVQVALHATGISKVDARSRIARARMLLQRRSITENDDTITKRLARKFADIDRMEREVQGMELEPK